MTLLVVGQRVGDRYVVQGEVGRGGMQEVYRAYDETLQRDVALKVPQDASAARKFRESAVLSARVNHPNVAKTLDYFEDSARFYMVEELVPGENLREVLSKFERLDCHAAAHLLHHLARAVTASHRVGVIHRDLKPSNIMVPGGLAFEGIKVTDFGIAKMAEKEVGDAVEGGEESTRASRTVMNALAYVAPEVIESPRVPGKPADVWAIAAITWEVLTGQPPFGSGLKAIRLLMEAKLPALPPSVRLHTQFGGLSKQLGELIASCLQASADARPTAEVLSARCDELCYFPPRRELGTIETYPRNTFGFINADNDNESIFFHVKNVVADKKPPVGTRVWFTRFEGQPKARAIPVVPLR